jgi:hypothetical protein
MARARTYAKDQPGLGVGTYLRNIVVYARLAG